MAEEQDRRSAGNGKSLPLIPWIIGALLLAIWIYADYRASLESPVAISAPIRLSVHAGQGISSVAQDLRSRDVLPEPIWFELAAWFRGAGGDLKAGEYDIPKGTTIQGLLDILLSGKTRQPPVTIIEGWTFAQMMKLLSSHPGLRQELVGKTQEEIMALIGAPGKPPEGQFFPDTYFTGKNVSDLDILKKAYKKMQSVLAEEWQGRSQDLPLATSDEALTLASIVEKETGRADERPAIAGVFVRRLKQGMRLQTDPTVIYGMGDQYKGNIRKDDLRRDTPFNTYTRSGLPPTPIALPGRQAIHAAVHPAEGTSLYFVAKGDGSHVFSSTLDEHERAVNSYQRHR